jgi:molybdenum ABC transporter molybdate-binding protein
MLRLPRRPGRLNGPWLTFLGSVALLAALVGLLIWNPQETDKRPLFVYCAAGIRPPVEAAAREYEELYGVRIQLTYGGSDTLLSNLEVSGRGDLYIPADEDYMDRAREKGLVDESIPLARMTGVLAVRPGNPKKLHKLKDLLDKDVKLALANPDVAAIGLLTKKALQKAGRWEALARKKHVNKVTVTDVANDVKLGAVDAGIVWDATVRQYDGALEAVELPELKDVQSHVGVGVLRSCDRPASALRFARFLAASDRGLVKFKDKGYTTVDGDPWADGEPILTVYAGAMLQPAIEQTIEDFAAREGIPRKNIRCIYNGCGILLGQMKLGQHPDAFFACDATFMKEAKALHLFGDDTAVSTNRLVIVVHKGNPRGIHAIRDLKRDGLRVGIGNEHKCAMGVLTEETLRQAGVRRGVKKNVAVESATGAELILRMQAAPSKLDAVIAYISDVKKAEDRLEAVPIDLPCAVATQPIALGRETKFKQLASRLRAALLSPESQRRFEEAGFVWKATTR